MNITPDQLQLLESLATQLYTQPDRHLEVKRQLADFSVAPQNVEKFNLLLNEYLDGKFKQIHWRNIYLNYYSAFKWAVKRGHIVLACKSLYKFLWYKK